MARSYSDEWVYPPELVGALAGFGLAPLPRTDPLVVRDALNDLYRYELRRMRDRLLARELDKPAYLAAVIALRKKYWPLTLQPKDWIAIASPPAPAPSESQS